MSREEKQQTQQAELQKQLWSIANSLRGNMDANDFKNYILGLIFYKYLSENRLIQSFYLPPHCFHNINLSTSFR